MDACRRARDSRRRRLSRAEQEDRNWRWRRSDPLPNALPWRLIAARRRSGLTQQQVAEQMGATRSAISRLESGLDRRPSLTTIESYAVVVGRRVEVALQPWP